MQHVESIPNSSSRIVRFGEQKFEFQDFAGSPYLTDFPDDGEPDLRAVINEFCAAESISVDVGGNIGFTSTMLGLRCAKVLAIEASPQSARYFRRNTNPISTVTLYECAATATKHDVEIQHPLGFAAGGFISSHVDHTLANCSKFVVKGVPLDEIVAAAGIPRVDFIKIDVEGFELDVLKGGREAIRKFRPNAYIEVHFGALNMYQHMSVPTMLAHLREFFPVQFAIDTNMEVIPLDSPQRDQDFYYQNCIAQRFTNLICGFDADDMAERIARFSAKS